MKKAWWRNTLLKDIDISLKGLGPKGVPKFTKEGRPIGNVACPIYHKCAPPPPDRTGPGPWAVVWAWLWALALYLYTSQNLKWFGLGLSGRALLGL